MNKGQKNLPIDPENLCKSGAVNSSAVVRVTQLDITAENQCREWFWFKSSFEYA
jgi:hypothetical protein